MAIEMGDCLFFSTPFSGVITLHTVDGRNPANQLGLAVYLIIHKVLAPSQVLSAGFLNHQRCMIDG